MSQQSEQITLVLCIAPYDFMSPIMYMNTIIVHFAQAGGYLDNH